MLQTTPTMLQSKVGTVNEIDALDGQSHVPSGGCGKKNRCEFWLANGTKHESCQDEKCPLSCNDKTHETCYDENYTKVLSCVAKKRGEKCLCPGKSGVKQNLCEYWVNGTKGDWCQDEKCPLFCNDKTHETCHDANTCVAKKRGEKCLCPGKSGVKQNLCEYWVNGTKSDWCQDEKCDLSCNDKTHETCYDENYTEVLSCVAKPGKCPIKDGETNHTDGDHHVDGEAKGQHAKHAK